jgi:hypothetical protein
MDIEALGTAEREARESYYQADRALKQLMNELVRTATERIRQEHISEASDVSRKYDAYRLAKKAMEDAEIEESQQKILTTTNGTVLKAGDRVTGYKPSNWRNAEKTVTGIVEVVTRDTVFPDNTASYSRPPLAAFIVRLLTKDGTPGKKFETLDGYVTWKKVE